MINEGFVDRLGAGVLTALITLGSVGIGGGLVVGFSASQKNALLNGETINFELDKSTSHLDYTKTMARQMAYPNGHPMKTLPMNPATDSSPDEVMFKMKIDDNKANSDFASNGVYVDIKNKIIYVSRDRVEKRSPFKLHGDEKEAKRSIEKQRGNIDSMK
jgi:hypothetical protein